MKQYEQHIARDEFNGAVQLLLGEVLESWIGLEGARGFVDPGLHSLGFGLSCSSGGLRPCR